MKYKIKLREMYVKWRLRKKEFPMFPVTKKEKDILGKVLILYQTDGGSSFPYLCYKITDIADNKKGESLKRKVFRSLRGETYLERYLSLDSYFDFPILVSKKDLRIEWIRRLLLQPDSKQ